MKVEKKRNKEKKDEPEEISCLCDFLSKRMLFTI
jgi:hypothetical protein